MARQLQPREKDIQKIVDTVREGVNGRHNAVGSVTLRANQTTTVVTHENCSKDCAPRLQPQTANAAAAFATTYIRPVDVLQGSFTITHASNAQTDKDFYYSVSGG